MLLNESDLKTLIKSIVKEVRDESFSDDLLGIPPHMSSESGLSDMHSKAVQAAVKEIRQLLDLHQVDANTPIYDPNTHDQSKMDLPSMLVNKAINIIISVCRRLDESLPSEEELRGRFYRNEVPKDGGFHTISDVVAMFIPRNSPKQE